MSLDSDAALLLFHERPRGARSVESLAHIRVAGSGVGRRSAREAEAAESIVSMTSTEERHVVGESSVDRVMARFGASLDLAASLRQTFFRVELAAFLRSVVAGSVGLAEVRRFIDSTDVQREYFAVLEPQPAASVGDFSDFITETLANDDNFIQFASLFPPPLHAVAHIVFLLPLAVRRLWVLAAVYSVGGGRVLPFDMVLAIEARQREQAPLQTMRLSLIEPDHAARNARVCLKR